MSLVHFIAKIARHTPYMVQKARYFRHFRSFPRLKIPVGKMDELYVYIVQHGIQNRDNKTWGLMADKYAVRKEIDRILGPGHLVPLLGAWENPEDIDFDSLPKSFVLKTNNGCGTNIFVHDKNEINRDSLVAKFKKDLTFPYPELTGQPHYRLIKPMVIAEALMDQGKGEKSLRDYKIHCVNGEPVTLYIFSNRDEVNHFDFNMKAYTADWRELPHHATPDDVKDNPEAPDKPAWLDDMLDMARKLSANEEYVRVDFYCIDGKIYFGEMTYTPDTRFHQCYSPYQEAMHYILEMIKAQRKDKSTKSE